MLEVESKYWSPGKEKVLKALARLGAEKVSEEEMEDVYFGHPCKEYGKSDESLRLRKRSGDAELTYKGPRMHLEHTKAREEITLRISDPLAAQRIVERLGFEERMVIRKTRATFLLDKLRVEVDDVEGLGEFVELELITEEPARAARLMETARKELELERIEPLTYMELLLKKNS